MGPRFDYRNCYYWKLIRSAIHLSINENHAAITGSEQKYEILFETFLETLSQTDNDNLKSFLCRRRKSVAFESRLQALGIQIDKDNRNFRFISFHSHALQLPQLPQWCGDSSPFLNIGNLTSYYVF